METEGDGNAEEEMVDAVHSDSPPPAASPTARRITRAAAAAPQQRAGTLPTHTHDQSMNCSFRSDPILGSFSTTSFLFAVSNNI